MTTYERTLIAHGISPEAARRDALANELVRLANREHPAYGVTDFPARHLTARPSRQVAGSSPDAPEFDYFRTHSYEQLAGGF